MPILLLVSKVLEVKIVQWALVGTLLFLSLLLAISKVDNHRLQLAGRVQAVKIGELTNQITKQNDAVVKLNADAAAVQKLVSKLQIAAEAARRTYDQKAQQILTKKVGNTCQEAIQWGIENAVEQSVW